MDELKGHESVLHTSVNQRRNERVAKEKQAKAEIEEERRLAFVAFTRAKVRVAAVSARQCVPVRGW